MNVQPKCRAKSLAIWAMNPVYIQISFARCTQENDRGLEIRPRGPIYGFKPIKRTGGQVEAEGRDGAGPARRAGADAATARGHHQAAHRGDHR